MKFSFGSFCQFGGKALQKRILNVLVDRTTFLTLVACFFLIIISALSFGEAWLQWSADKYAALFNSFSDNLLERSLQTRLCQHVPVDVVYTWVNGSDPWFQDSLKHIRESAIETLKIPPGQKRLTECPYDDCFPSHFLTTDRHLDPKVKAADLKIQNKFLQNLESLENLNLKCKEGEHHQHSGEKTDDDDDDGDQPHHDHAVTNRTFLVMESPDAAKNVIAQNKTSFQFGLSVYPIRHAYWTTDPFAPSSYHINNFLILKKLPQVIDEKTLLSVLPESLSRSITRVWFHQGKQQTYAVVETKSAKLFEDKTFAIKDAEKFLLSKPAYLVLSPPEYSEDDSYTYNRFVDREELRYSLRSIEKYAPWVRKIFLVTNGQIPYWLNLDHPRLTVVTHDEIFEDRSNLPTFSSPAIEANIYRIPGLSSKFLYMNDDVFLGKEIWPEDLYTEQSGQKIYFSWPLPDCSKGCPNSWIKDGYCDRVCNTTECMFDGGDCLGDQPRMGYAEGEDLRHWADSGDLRPTCSASCLDNWLADKFCDETCNNLACGFDAGDCGISHFSKLFEIPFQYSPNVQTFNFTIPNGIAIAYWNVSKLYQLFSEVGVVPVYHKALRYVGLSAQSRVITMILYPEEPNIKINFTLQAKSSNLTVIHDMIVIANTSGYVEPASETDEDSFNVMPEYLSQNGSRRSEADAEPQLPPHVELAVAKPDDSQDQKLIIDDSEIESHLSEGDKAILEILKRQLNNEEITAKGFHIKKAALFANYQKKNDGQRRLLSVVTEDEATRRMGRKLLDLYGDSLLHVNRLYNHAYGHSSRMVVSHMPHLIDKEIFEEMRIKFIDEWEKTSRHQLRRADDMQFAFSYFHFLMSEKKDFDAQSIFEEFDTDLSDTWSDREIRTLLTRIFDLPLTLTTVKSFEQLIVNCANNLTGYNTPPSMPPFERYFDSNLPVVSSDLVVRCELMVKFLKDNFKDRRRYKFEVVKSSVADTSFKRLTSNLSQVVQSLDDLRRQQRKFFCINDNTQPDKTEENKLVHAVLVDFLESILPVPSSFELPPDYRNKFRYTFELNKWKFYRAILTNASYLCVLMLVVLFVSGYLEFDLESKVQSCFRRLLRNPSSNSNRYTV